MRKALLPLLTLLLAALVSTRAYAAAPDWKETGTSIWIQVDQGLDLATGGPGEDLVLTATRLTARGGLVVVPGASRLDARLVPPADGYSTSIAASAAENRVLVVKTARGFAQVYVGMGWLGGSGVSSLQIVGWYTAAPPVEQPQPEPLPDPMPTPDPQPVPHPVPEPTPLPKREIRMRVGSAAASIDGKAVTLDVPPRLAGDRVMLPVRFVGDALGATFRWDAVERKVTIARGARTIVLWVDKTRVMANGSEQQLDAPPLIVEHRLLVPLRLVSEMLGGSVAWSPTDQSIVVTSSE